MLIPFQVVMLPLFLLVMRLGLTHESGWLAGWLGLALPFAISGFGIFFVREALKTLPPDMMEAAVLDGANAVQRLVYVVVPLLKPTLATLAIFTLLASWGEFLWPSIVLSHQEQFTLPLGLVQLQGQFGSDWRLIAAGTLLSMVPVLVLFVLLQHWFLQSNATDAGVKG
jgi:putative chitobiose transport system permease protein